ncbi:MAG TPA: AraC family transcriptional regulator [Pyrinomonadaceae bacterium]|jgi:AraC-like DNA-binding protein|nr:AraC family transcriptional regulator [Pyrinomonadaceae bacterium]
MPVVPTISVRSAIKVVAAAAARGVSPETLCGPAGLDPASLEDADRRMPFTQFVAFYNRAAQLTGDPLLGLHVGERISPNMFDVLGYVAMNSPDFGEAMRRLMRYHRIWDDGIGYRMETFGDEVHFSFSYVVACPVEERRQDCESTMAIIVRFARVATGTEWEPREVHFEHAAPVDTSEHERVFRAPVRFEMASNKIIFDRSLLALPLEGADAGLCAVLDRHAEELLAKTESRGAVSQKVRQLLQEAMHEGDAGLEAVSNRMGLSSRTLQRKLKEEGTSHQDLLDEMRRDLSKRYLREPGMAICEVAYLLGFSEPSAFHRAFRRWTGITPKEYRQNGR